jgi:hypothetical protein
LTSWLTEYTFAFSCSLKALSFLCVWLRSVFVCAQNNSGLLDDRETAVWLIGA